MSSRRALDVKFRRSVLLKCYEALEEAGFARFRKEHVDWPHKNGFHGWVGLNVNQERDYLQINPFVGIHVVQIEKLWTGLKSSGGFSSKYDRSCATYAIHIGELAPSEDVFRFTPETNLDAEAGRLASLYLSVGLAYAESISNYERLLPLLRNRAPMLGAYPERVAVCLYLMGHEEEARLFTEGFLGANRDYFEAFAVSFLNLLHRAEDMAP